MIVAPDFMKSDYFYCKDEIQALKPEASEAMKREFEEYYNLGCNIEDDYPEIDTPYHT